MGLSTFQVGWKHSARAREHEGLLSLATINPDSPIPSKIHSDPDLFNNVSLDSPLVYKNRIVGRFSAIPGLERRFLVKPIAALPLRTTQLGTYLEEEYAKFHLEIEEEGAISFTLDLNGSLGIVLASIGWAYGKLLRLPR